jgi:hypothetical protein
VATVLGPLAWERLRERAVMEHWSATDEEGMKHALTCMYLFIYLFI